MEEIQRADSQARSKAIAAVTAGAILGGGGLIVLEHYWQSLVTWLVGSPSRAKLGILVGVIVLGFVPLLLAAIWAWRLGARVIREGRHPPEGFKVIRDTPVVQGAAARNRGRALQALGALFVVSGGIMLWVFTKLWYLP